MRINVCLKCNEVIDLEYAPYKDGVLCPDCAMVFDMPITRNAIPCFECGQPIAPTDKLMRQQTTRMVQHWHYDCWAERFAPSVIQPGAWIKIKWLDSKEQMTVWVSFMIHDEGSEEDESTFYYMNAENCTIGYTTDEWVIIDIVAEPRF